MGMLCLLCLHQCQHPGCDMHFSFENVAFGGNWVKHSEDLTVLFLMKVKVLVARLCPTLCNSMDYSTPGSSVHGILQAGILEQIAVSFSRVSSQPRGQTQVSCIAGRLLTIWAIREAHMWIYSLLWIISKWKVCVHAKIRPLCLTLCDPVDCSPPGSSVHGILQSRILEWVVMPSSRRSSRPRDQTCGSSGSCLAGRFFATEPLGMPTCDSTIISKKKV